MRNLVPLLFLLLVACAGADRPVPEGTMDREHFKRTLLEAQLVEARMNHELINMHQSDIPADRYYTDMFKAQGTTKEEFEKAWDYYSGQPEEMKLIYEEIFTEISRRKDEQPQ